MTESPTTNRSVTNLTVRFLGETYHPVDDLTFGRDAELFIDDNNDIGYNVNSLVLYSADGVNWGATALDGLSINDIEVGTDDVLIFTSDPRLVNSGEPQPLLLGTV